MVFSLKIKRGASQENIATWFRVQMPPRPPFYGWFIPILVLLFFAMWDLSSVYNSYKKKRVIKQLERERFIKQGAMVICSNCGMETMIKCPDCGKQLFRKVLYCSTCGKPLEK